MLGSSLGFLLRGFMIDVEASECLGVSQFACYLGLGKNNIWTSVSNFFNCTSAMEGDIRQVFENCQVLTLINTL